MNLLKSSPYNTNWKHQGHTYHEELAFYCCSLIEGDAEGEKELPSNVSLPQRLARAVP